ncbi:MAG TPA: IPTL-CTERM sorting domain-containing protein, partial [Thermoanaerobaculia bacterium]|nr:IPTL-CTERM sorting domain-containing protein [Thermoanaerobaculia bacterium]
ADVTEIACQGRVLASNVSTPAPTPTDPPGTVLTDDPDTTAPDDPTVTPVARRPDGIVEVPTLSEIGLLLLTLSLAGFAVVRIRRSPATLTLPGGRG